MLYSPMEKKIIFFCANEKSSSCNPTLKKGLDEGLLSVPVLCHTAGMGFKAVVREGAVGSYKGPYLSSLSFAVEIKETDHQGLSQEVTSR